MCGNHGVGLPLLISWIGAARYKTKSIENVVKLFKSKIHFHHYFSCFCQNSESLVLANAAIATLLWGVSRDQYQTDIPEKRLLGTR